MELSNFMFTVRALELTECLIQFDFEPFSFNEGNQILETHQPPSYDSRGLRVTLDKGGEVVVLQDSTELKHYELSDPDLCNSLSTNLMDLTVRGYLEKQIQEFLRGHKLEKIHEPIELIPLPGGAGFMCTLNFYDTVGLSRIETSEYWQFMEAVKKLTYHGIFGAELKTTVIPSQRNVRNDDENGFSIIIVFSYN